MNASIVAQDLVLSGTHHLLGTDHCRTNGYYSKRLKPSDGCAGCQGISATVDSLIRQLTYLLR